MQYELESSDMAPSTNRITLRLPNSVLNALKKEAEKRDLPLNALVTKMLTKIVSFDMQLDATPTIIMSHALLTKLIDKIDETAMEEVAKEGPNIIKNLFTILGSRYEIDNIINNYLITLGKYCGWYKFSPEITRNHYRLVFEIQLGSKWVKFVTAYVKNILESLKIHIDNESINHNVVVFEFVKR
jgi:hypothetical protein